MKVSNEVENQYPFSTICRNCSHEYIWLFFLNSTHNQNDGRKTPQNKNIQLETRTQTLFNLKNSGCGKVVILLLYSIIKTYTNVSTSAKVHFFVLVGLVWFCASITLDPLFHSVTCNVMHIIAYSLYIYSL